MRLQRGCLRNYPSKRQTVERGDSSLPFFGESGSLQTRLIDVPRQPPRFPLRETPFCLRNDTSEVKGGGVRSAGFVEHVTAGIGKVFPLLLSELRQVGDVRQAFCSVQDELCQNWIPGPARPRLTPGNASARDAGPMMVTDE